MATISNVKLPDLINRWIEVQNPGTGGMDGTDGTTKEPLNIDAINLTLLLKSMGMRLQYLDFDDEKTNTDALTISIKCNRSGIRSELSYDLQQQGCSCPEKTEQDSSFWEVQATGPRVFSKFKNNTSSNLLPDVSERCALVSKAMLANLLDYYQCSIRQVKEGKERAMLKSPLKPVTSPGLTMRNPFSTPPAEGRCTARMSLGSTREPLLKRDFQDVEADRPEEEKTKETGGSVANRGESNGSGTATENHNLTHDIPDADSENVHKPVIDPVVTANGSEPDGESVFNCNEAMKHVITSSPVIRKVPAPASSLHDTVDMQQERDVNVINHLQQARSQIDMALLLMMAQGTTQDMFGGSALTLTPQQNTAIARRSLGSPRFPPARAGSLLTIERRRTVAEAGSGIKKKALPTTPSTLAGRLSLGAGGSMIAGRVDTPRPSLAQVKSIAGLRRTVTMPPPAAVRQKPVTGAPAGTTVNGQRRLPPSSSATSVKTVVPRQPISLRPATSSANRQAGLINRSSSASLLTKK